MTKGILLTYAKDKGKAVSPQADAARTKARETGMRLIHVSDPITGIAQLGLLSVEQGGAALMLFSSTMADEKPFDIGEVEWVEAVKQYCQDRGLLLILVEDSKANLASSTKAKVIADYQQAQRTLASKIKELNKVTTLGSDAKYVKSRPPYGYRSVDGRLQVIAEEAKAIRYLFECLDSGDTVAETLIKMKAQYGEVAIRDPASEGKESRTRRIRQTWDHTKIMRLIDRMRLYCEGVYEVPGEHPICIPDLAFLPAEWATRDWPISKIRKQPNRPLANSKKR